jgi:ferredoxin-NADP reductase
MVSSIIPLNELVTRFEFERVDGADFPPFSGGAHTVVEMNDNGIKRLNPYSLMSNPQDLSKYAISVRRDDNGRGGSLFMHNNVKTGMKMTLSNPVNLFPLDLRARKHLMIAGGIGITPFLAQIAQLSAMGSTFELHYSVRSKQLGSYTDQVSEKHTNNAHIYYGDQGQRIDLEALLEGQPLGTHIYVCGPEGMINSVRSEAEKASWPSQAIHFEEFLAPEPGEPFEVTLSASGKTLQVTEHQSLLEAIEAAGIDAPYLCRGGACGQCETNVVSHDGEFCHHDHWLDDEEKASGEKIMPCVSRFVGKSLVLDR